MAQSPGPRSSRVPRLTGPTRIYHGWHVAWVVFLSTGLSIGMAQYAFGVFGPELEEEFGWSRTQVNASLSFAFISGMSAPLVGRLADRFGTRPVLVVSLLLAATGFALRPLISELWHLYLFSTLVYVGFPGATVLPAGKMVGLWFPTTRGRMMGMVTAGNNFGGLTMVPFAAALVALAGWRWAYFGFGVMLAVLAVAALAIIRERASDVEAEIDRTGRTESFGGEVKAAARAGLTVSQALRTPAFYLVTVAITAATFTYQGIITQLIQHLENVGISHGAASAALSLVAAMGIGSKLAFGRASESIGARQAMVISTALQALGLGLMIAPGGTMAVWAGVFVFGLGFGGLGALIVLVVSETFGLREYGGIMGLVQFATIISFAGGPLLAGMVFDATGSYQNWFAAIIGIFALGITALLLTRRPSFPRQAEEPKGVSTAD
ncbi:MAG: MFS transporter [Dehalococcoidia bacterium]